MAYLMLRTCPRVAPLGWPHTVHPYDDEGRTKEIFYSWVYIKPDGSGWSSTIDDSLAFPEGDLEGVIERFYEWAGPWPFDFEVTIVPAPTKRRKKRRAGKRKKKP